METITFSISIIIKKNFQKQIMLQPLNYRTSLKKNISLKTLNDFKPSKKASTKFQPIYQKTNNPKYKKSFKNSFQSQNYVLSCQKLSQKNFSFDSSDHYIKKILISHQWNVLPTNFTQVKLLWIAIPKPIHFKFLQPNQLINHFRDSYKLTTKLGLYNLLSSPHQQKITDNHGRNYINYFPRSYDLGPDFDSFCQDFNHTAVLNLMKKLMIHIEIIHEKTLYIKYKKICQKQYFKNCQEQLLHEIQFTLKNRNDLFDKQPLEQRILVNRTVFINLLKYWKYYFDGNSYQKLSFSPLMQNLKTFSKLNPPFNNLEVHFTNQSQITFLTHSSAILFFKLYFYCLQTNHNFLNDGLSNIWIIKSNESSRGRNIFLIDDIDQVQPYRNGGNKLIQKYIENVWILNQSSFVQSIETLKTEKIHKIVNKKFDIRFWVLVKSFTPLDAYIIQQGYLRLSSESYKFSTNESLQQNLKTHLTNFSINFLPNLKHQNPSTKNSENIQDNSYLLFSDFLNFIEGQQKYNSGKNIHKSELFQKISKKIHHILMNASINWRPAQTDKNSFELFGFDIILDSELQPYVLECNMSPACQQRGQLKGLVHEMGQGLLEIVGLIKPNEHKDTEMKDKRKKWIKFTPDSQNYDVPSHEGLTRNNHQDLSIIGHSRSTKFILEQDQMIDFVSGVFYLQGFFKNRYRGLYQRSADKDSISMSCLMIEVLARVVKKRQEKWVKKFIKCVKKINKKKSNVQNIASKKLKFHQD